MYVLFQNHTPQPTQQKNNSNMVRLIGQHIIWLFPKHQITIQEKENSKGKQQKEYSEKHPDQLILPAGLRQSQLPPLHRSHSRSHLSCCSLPSNFSQHFGSLLKLSLLFHAKRQNIFLWPYDILKNSFQPTSLVDFRSLKIKSLFLRFSSFSFPTTSKDALKHELQSKCERYRQEVISIHKELLARGRIWWTTEINRASDILAGSDDTLHHILYCRYFNEYILYYATLNVWDVHIVDRRLLLIKLLK